MKNLYHVKEGRVREVNKYSNILKTCNWLDEVIALASDCWEAEELSERYKKGEIERERIFYPDSYGIYILEG